MMKRMMKTKLLAGLMAGLMITLSSMAEDGHHREHGGHTHGLAQLNIALEGNTLVIELESPAVNIVGFEHKPRSSKEHEVLESAMASLHQPDLLFVMDSAANCQAGHIEIDSGFEDGGVHEAHHGHGQEHHTEDNHREDEEHSDIDAHYELSCANTDKLKMIDVRLFERFPAMHNIALQFIGERGQTSVQLDKDTPIFKVPR